MNDRARGSVRAGRPTPYTDARNRSIATQQTTTGAMADPTTTRRSRRSSRTARDVGRERAVAAFAVIAVFVAGGAALASISPDRPASVAATTGAWTAIASAETPAPTPVFASLRGTELHLPIAACDVTVLAFHQSSYNDTVAVRPLIELGSPAAAKEAAIAARAARKAGEEATIAATPVGAEDSEGTWTGSALELWRTGRNGKQKTAVDCGAAAGSSVYSPVDGTVMQVRPYKLYGKYDDFEIHIKPDAWSDLDVIVLHVTDPAIEPGTRVIAGLTRIARVRALSKVVSGLQLRTYTLDGGNHTHVQVNRIPRPAETWIVGQDPPGFVRRN